MIDKILILDKYKFHFGIDMKQYLGLILNKENFIYTTEPTYYYSVEENFLYKIDIREDYFYNTITKWNKILDRRKKINKFLND